MKHKFIFFLLGIVTILSIVGLRIFEISYQSKYLFEDYKNSNNPEIFLKIMERSNLTAQEKYDLVYLNYNKFNDPKFIMAYNLAYNNCITNSDNCSLREDSQHRLNIGRQSCLNNYDSYCISIELSKDNIQRKYEEKLIIFEKAIIKYENCLEPSLHSFFKIIKPQDRNKLSPIIFKVCNNF